ncbi:hypothetical protein KR009_007727 [Drosophila setifemur]|nr:hypothetical protein KR009_007727 [Drosophila setifemur]
MMQIPFIQICKVIFVLSTIVTVTDCCSSRILLLREHTLKIVQHQHNFHNHLHEHAHELQQHVIEYVNRIELQQLEGSAQESAAELNLEPVPKPDMDQLRALPDRETTDALDSDGNFETSTEMWLIVENSSPLTAEISTSSSTVTHIGEPPPDQTSPNPPDLSSSKSVKNDDKRKNVSEVQLLPCSEEYKANFCLNGGQCFHHPMVNSKVLHSCVCEDDYFGERCEFKNWNGDYVYAPPTLKRKVRMAHIVFSFPVLIMLSSLYVLFAAVFMLRNEPEYRQKQQQLPLRKKHFFVRC